MSPEGWAAIAVAVATCLLAVITGYYAVETHGMRVEMHTQREAELQRSSEARRARIREHRHAVSMELRQIVTSTESKRGTGRNYMKLSTAAWLSTFSAPEIWSDEVRTALFRIYDEVERMNAIRDMLLATMSTPMPEGAVFRPDASGFGLERHTSLDFLTRDIRAVLDLIEALPEPR